MTTELRYRGGSMRPTFTPGDVLVVEVGRRPVPAPGDVIVFRHPQTSDLVVHRVIRCQDGGWRTQGDAAAVDPYLVTADLLVGRVTGRRCGARVVAVAGGPAGTALARRRRSRRRRRAAVGRMWQATMTIWAGTVARRFAVRWLRAVEIRRAGGPERRLLLGSRTLARRSPGADTWVTSPLGAGWLDPDAVWQRLQDPDTREVTA